MKGLATIFEGFKKIFKSKETVVDSREKEIIGSPIIKNDTREVVSRCKNAIATDKKGNVTSKAAEYFSCKMGLTQEGIEKALEIISEKNIHERLLDKRGRKLNGAAFTNRLARVLHDHGYSY